MRNNDDGQVSCQVVGQNLLVNDIRTYCLYLEGRMSFYNSYRPQCKEGERKIFSLTHLQ